jgi:hypothetical protein
VDVPLQNIDSKDLGWKFFEWNILRRFGRYSAIWCVAKSRSPAGMTERKATTEAEAQAKGCACAASLFNSLFLL